LSRVSAAIDLIYDFVVEHIVSVDEKRHSVEYDDPIVSEINKVLLVLRWIINCIKGLEFIRFTYHHRLVGYFREALEENQRILIELANRIETLNPDVAEALRIIAKATVDDLDKHRTQLGIHNDVLVRRWKEKNPLG